MNEKQHMVYLTDNLFSLTIFGLNPQVLIRLKNRINHINQSIVKKR